jgi:hypothetical protein
MLNQKNNQKQNPITEVLQMKQKGLTNEQIIGELKNKSYSHAQIVSAMDQSEIKDVAVSEGNITNRPHLESIKTENNMVLENAPSPSPETEKRVPITTMQQPATMQSPSSAIQPEAQMPAERPNFELVEEIAESVVREKWEILLTNLGNINTWKDRTNHDIQAIKQEVLRTQQRFDNLQAAILGQVKDYGNSVKDMGAELQAIEKVLEKIVTPLTTNIKELSRITAELKRKKK